MPAAVELLRRRSDMAQAELLLAASDHALCAARKGLLPQLRLTGSASAASRPPLFKGGGLRAVAESANAQREALAETFRLASNRYSPYLEQLDAQRSLLGAELGLVQARADAFLARISLYQALGEGWNFDPSS